MTVTHDESWYYPSTLHLGKLDFHTEYEFMLRVAVPVPSRLTSKVTGLEVEPEWLAPGTNEVILRIEPLDRDTMLHGSLWLCASSEQERKIVVDGHVLRAPDGKPKSPKRLLAWEPAEWEILKSELPELPVPAESISPESSPLIEPVVVQPTRPPVRPPGPPPVRPPAPPPVRPPAPPPVRPPAPAVVAQPIKVGFPQSLAKESVDERWKGAAGFYLVRSDRYNGQDIVFALRSICPVEGCTPIWSAKHRKFKCPCHGNGFNISGINFEGPSRRPMERLKVAFDNDNQLVVDPNRRYQLERGEWASPESFVVIPAISDVAPPRRTHRAATLAGMVLVSVLLVVVGAAIMLRHGEESQSLPPVVGKPGEKQKESGKAVPAANKVLTSDVVTSATVASKSGSPRMR